jgi:hypothetical protein
MPHLNLKKTAPGSWLLPAERFLWKGSCFDALLALRACCRALLGTLALPRATRSKGYVRAEKPKQNPRLCLPCSRPCVSDHQRRARWRPGVATTPESHKELVSFFV